MSPAKELTYKDECATIDLSMKPPCEVVVKYMLPAFRSIIAKILVTEYHLSQVEVAQKMGTTQATISLYLGSKRGSVKFAEFEQAEVIRSAAQQIARDIATGKAGSNSVILTICRLCRVIRSHELLCDLHKSSATVPSSCDICMAPIL